MICTKCSRNLIRCICNDGDARIEKLRTIKYLLVDVDAMQAARFLAKHEIEADRKKEKETAAREVKS